MPTKIVQFGPWRRDGSYYDLSGEGSFLLQARNVVPVDGGYTGPPHVALWQDLAIGATTYGTNGDLVDSALATENHVYGSLVVTGGADILLRGDRSGGSWEDATGGTAWTGDSFGTSFAQWGDYVIAVGASQKAQYIDDTSAAGTNFSDLCVTTAPTASSFATADIRARFVFPYRDHLALANITLAANYPSTNPIYTGNATVGSAKVYGSVVWLSMQDNIRRYASPTVHPEVKGSIPLNLVDGTGSITGAIGGENAYIFKQDRVYKLIGPPFDAIPITDGIGTVSPNSIIRVKDQVYFLSNHGPAVIDGSTVTVLGYERFMNSLTDPRYETEIAAGWTGPSTSIRMLGNLIQTEAQTKRAVAMYSDVLGCVIWYFRTGRWIACRVNGSGAMSFGNTGDFFVGNNYIHGITAVCRMPDWLSSGFPNKNILFRQASSGNSVLTSYGYEDYSGTEGRIVPSNGAFHFTLPMMPMAADQEGGVLTTRITGFRLIGECHRHVRATLVRTLTGWNAEPLIRDRSGDVMESQDGWVNTPNTYAGKYHSLSFLLYDSTDETDYIRRPFFAGVEIRYESAVARGA